MTLLSGQVETLRDAIPADEVSDYLSGVVIGAEVALIALQPSAVAIVGQSDVARRYRDAMILAGIPDVASVDVEIATARGLWAIGCAAQ
jgi:2-keto-3-deoxy-galactonokinase